MNLKHNQLIYLLKPLYGLAKSGDYWGKTFIKHLEDDLGMKSCMSDASSFFNVIGDKVSGICATYVHDKLYAGDS